MNLVITQYRNLFTTTGTGGVVVCDDTRICETQEDAYRGEGLKIANETCIPATTYKVMIRYSPVFKREVVCLYNYIYESAPCVIHNGVFFSYIVLHGGEDLIEHTSGCVQVGHDRLSPHAIHDSAEQRILDIVKMGMADNAKVYYDIQNDFDDIHNFKWEG